MIKFGEKPKCVSCNVELDIFNMATWERGLFCRFCRPKPVKDRIGKYSGPSDRIKGAYERD